jgi:FkbM family methyltransferase
MSLSHLIRKAGRTAQVHVPWLQEMGKFAESRLRHFTGRSHDRDLEGLRLIDIPEGALILDIGANRGWAAQSIWSICPSARIEGFEPNPAMVKRFAYIYARNGLLHAVALSDRPGQFPLFIPIYRGVVFDGLASLNEQEAKSWLNAETVFGFDSRRLEIQQILCRVETLDSFDLRPFFIKIDVQGREYEVMAGGLTTIAASQPIIFAESETLDMEKTMSLLAPWKYQLLRFDGRFHPGEISRRNIYLVPEAKLSRLDLSA